MATSSMPTKPLDFPRIKILTLGNANVGKSCFVKRFCEDRFVAKYIPTIGIDYGVKRVEVNSGLLAKYLLVEEKPGSAKSNQPTAVRVNFWDVAGGSESAEIRNEFYGPAQGILLMYDVRDEDSFAALDQWWEEASRYIPLTDGAKPSIGAAGSTTANTPAGRAVGDNGGCPPVVILCANKVDKEGPGISTRRVTTEAGESWAKAHQCAAYYETSCTVSNLVMDPMQALVHQVIARFIV